MAARHGAEVGGTGAADQRLPHKVHNGTLFSNIRRMNNI
jgi:hypothetical protein